MSVLTTEERKQLSRDLFIQLKGTLAEFAIHLRQIQKRASGDSEGVSGIEDAMRGVEQIRGQMYVAEIVLDGVESGINRVQGAIELYEAIFPKQGPPNA